MQSVGDKLALNRLDYVEVLRNMPPESRLAKAFELTELTRELLRVGLAERHPAASDAQLRQLYLERLARCRSRSS